MQLDGRLPLTKSRLPTEGWEPVADGHSVVILQPQVRDHLFALQVAQRVLQLHRLDEQVMLGIQPGRRHRRFEVEA